MRSMASEPLGVTNGFSRSARILASPHTRSSAAKGALAEPASSGEARRGDDNIEDQCFEGLGLAYCHVKICWSDPCGLQPTP